MRTLILVALVVILLGLLPEEARAVPLSNAQMLNNTGIIALQCSPSVGGYVFQVQNGYPLPTSFVMYLTCDGLGQTSVPFSLNGTTTSTPLLITPQGGTVQNTLCSLTLTLVDPFTGQNTKRQTVSSSCGTVVNALGDGPDQCGYAAFWCMFDNGYFWHNFPSVFIIFIVLAVVFWIVPFTFIIMDVLDSSRTLKDHVMSRDHARSDQVTPITKARTYKPLGSQPGSGLNITINQEVPAPNAYEVNAARALGAAANKPQEREPSSAKASVTHTSVATSISSAGKPRSKKTVARALAHCDAHNAAGTEMVEIVPLYQAREALEDEFKARPLPRASSMLLDDYPGAV